MKIGWFGWRFVGAMALGGVVLTAGAAVEVRSLDGAWRFLRDNDEKIVASAADFDDAAWTQVTVPHDWAISGPFDPNVSGWQGKLPWRGAGWYRRTVELPEAEFKALQSEKKAVYLEFDGVMARPEVWVNGEKAGGWDYGYMSFQLEVTKFLRPGRNVIAVHCSTKTHRSRWYPGAGIYRPVRLVIRPEVHVIPGSMDITTPEVTAEKAVVRVRYATKLGKKDTHSTWRIRSSGTWRARTSTRLRRKARRSATASARSASTRTTGSS